MPGQITRMLCSYSPCTHYMYTWQSSRTWASSHSSSYKSKYDFQDKGSERWRCTFMCMYMHATTTLTSSHTSLAQLYGHIHFIPMYVPGCNAGICKPIFTDQKLTLTSPSTLPNYLHFYLKGYLCLKRPITLPPPNIKGPHLKGRLYFTSVFRNVSTLTTYQLKGTEW